MDWLYNYHGVLGMSVHPSFSGGLFSALALGSGTQDKWLGIFGDRADISADTYYRLILHIWKFTVVADGFPFSGVAQKKLAVRYNSTNEFHRHTKIGSKVLLGLLVSFWDPRVRKEFFRNPDMSNIWPAKKARTKSSRRLRRGA
jgi:hypothetical protein